MSPSRPKERRGTGSAAMSLGTTMAAGFVLFGGLGYYADYRRGDGGYTWTIVGCCLALASRFYEVWKLTRLMEEADKANAKTQEDEE